MSEIIEKPSSLVRFYGNPEHALSCLEENKLSLGHIRNFNDPFDPVKELVTDFDTADDIVKWIKRNRPAHAHSCKKERIEHLIKIANEQLNAITEDMYSVCFYGMDAKEDHPNSLYMWGHYADGHRSIAIKFDYSIMNKKYDEKILPIHYDKKLEEINCKLIYDLMNPNKESGEIYKQKISRNLETKTKNWDFEKEWRLRIQGYEFIEHSIGRINVKLPENAISAIYLGCNIKPQQYKECIDKIKNALKEKKHKPIIYKAEKVLKDLSLQFTEVTT